MAAVMLGMVVVQAERLLGHAGLIASGGGLRVATEGAFLTCLSTAARAEVTAPHGV